MVDHAMNDDLPIVPIQPDVQAAQTRRRIIEGWEPVARGQMRIRIGRLITRMRDPNTSLRQLFEPLNLQDDGDVRRKLKERIIGVLTYVLRALDNEQAWITKRQLKYDLRNATSTVPVGEGVERIPLFPPDSPRIMWTTLRFCCELLNCNLQSLAICAGDSGLITGAASLRWVPGGQLIRLTNHHELIKGNVAAMESLYIEGDFSQPGGVILVVESAAAFYALRHGQLCNDRRRPILMITGCGFPSYGTRAILFKIHDMYPNTPILALTDYNLSGYHIYETFCGRAITSELSPVHDPPMPMEIKWLGMNFVDAERVNVDKRQPLTPEDIQHIDDAIVNREGQSADTLADAQGISENCSQLILMKTAGFKAQITDMEGFDGITLTAVVRQKIDQWFLGQ